MSILKIENLSKNFYLHEQQKEITSCKNISFELEKGKFIGIVDTSGAGKSTATEFITCLKEVLCNRRSL